MQQIGWTVGLFCLFFFSFLVRAGIYSKFCYYTGEVTTGEVNLSPTHILMKSVTNGNTSCRNSESLENLIKMEDKGCRYPVPLSDTQQDKKFPVCLL